eukprot:scaffold97867_cov33-Prasinocladus_malaysianus.AAC.2
MIAEVSYYSDEEQDSAFGALYDFTADKWEGCCFAQPPHNRSRARSSLIRALQITAHAEAPVACFMLLPKWKDAPHLGATFRGHPDILCLDTIPARSVTLTDDANGPGSDLNNLPRLDLLLVANKEGMAEYYIPMQLKNRLISALRDACHGVDTHVE